jgi:hypothetical protein
VTLHQSCRPTSRPWLTSAPSSSGHTLLVNIPCVYGTVTRVCCSVRCTLAQIYALQEICDKRFSSFLYPCCVARLLTWRRARWRITTIGKATETTTGKNSTTVNALSLRIPRPPLSPLTPLPTTTTSHPGSSPRTGQSRTALHFNSRPQRWARNSTDSRL